MTSLLLTQDDLSRLVKMVTVLVKSGTGDVGIHDAVTTVFGDTPTTPTPADVEPVAAYPNGKRRWSEREVADATTWRNLGMPTEEIAQRLGRSAGAVEFKFYEIDKETGL